MNFLLGDLEPGAAPVTCLGSSILSPETLSSSMLFWLVRDGLCSPLCLLRNTEREGKLKLWTCPGLRLSDESLSLAVSVSHSLKSVSSVSETVPPGCLHDDGFLKV